MPALEEEQVLVELKDYLLIVRRRWRLILLALLAVVAVATTVTAQATPMYSSSARLFVSTTEADAGQAFAGGQFAAQRVSSYADLVPKSRRLADEVSDALGGGTDALQLQGGVTAAVVPETVNLEITALDADPVRARDIAQAYAEALSNLVAELETPEGKTEAPIRADIVDNAQVDTGAVSPQPVRNLGLALVLGLLLGIGLAVARELLDNSVTGAEDLAEITPAPLLGHISVDQSAVEMSPAQALAGTSRWAEAFRVLRTNLQYVEVDHEQKVFVVTSSLPGEGKSTTVVNLAITLAMADQRVALVECDLRRPLIARRLGLDGDVGSTSVLIGAVSLEDAFQPYLDTGLQVLACGPIPPNPSELLQSQAMSKLLVELRQQFDIVLLDAPPLLPVTDAAVLATQTDGALLVVKHGRTRRDQLAHAVERLDAVDAKTLGVVLNMTPVRGSGSAYGYGYGGYSPLTDDTKKPLWRRDRRSDRHTATGRRRSTPTR